MSDLSEFEKRMRKISESRPKLTPEFRKKMHDLLFEGPDEPFLLSSLITEAFEWEKWAPLIPYIPFKPEWEVKMMPPFAGAIVRFWIREIGKNEHVSVYLDCYDLLGNFGEPYWEVYPVEDDIERVAMPNVFYLVEAIERGLSSLQRNHEGAP